MIRIKIDEYELEINGRFENEGRFNDGAVLYFLNDLSMIYEEAAKASVREASRVHKHRIAQILAQCCDEHGLYGCQKEG